MGYKMGYRMGYKKRIKFIERESERVLFFCPKVETIKKNSLFLLGPLLILHILYIQVIDYQMKSGFNT